MAYTPRTIAQIQAQILAYKNAQSALSTLTSTSKTAYWNLWIFIQAVAINLLEQIMSIFMSDIEAVIAEQVPGTAPWIKQQVLNFQYGDVVQINADFTIGYPAADTKALIVSQCSVATLTNGFINIKVATGTPPVPLDGSPGNSGPQVSALSSYLTTILPAGATFSITNQASDTLQVNAVIYYNAQYNTSIQENVIAALNTYSTSLPFNGIVKVTDIERTVLAVSGVTDVVISQITCVGGGTTVNLVLGSTVLSREYQTVSGYLTNASSPYDYANTLSYVISNN